MWAWHKLHSKRLLHFAALHTYCTCHSCVRNMEGFPGHNVNSGALLTAVGQSSRYTDHGFVATKHAMPPSFPPATWSTEQMST